MSGNIYIKGKLYITDSDLIKQLKSEGIVIYVEDCIFYSKKEDVELGENDVFIENLFDKFDVKNIVLN